MRVLVVLMLATLAGGCARYEFNVIEPEALAGHIGAKDEQAVLLARPPMEYRMQAAEGRLVVRITNTLDQPVEILGEKSFVVDPAGGSHPLRSQTIAPKSYVKMILPPMRTAYPVGPTWSVGVGVSSYYGPGWYDPYFGPRAMYDPFWADPRYMVVVDDSDNTFWSWAGEGTVRLHMVYGQGGKVFDQEFVFQRVKVK